MCNNPESLWIWVCPDDNNTIFFPILTLKNNKMKCSVKVLATTTNFCRRWYLHLTPVIVLLLMSNSTFDLMSLFVLKAFWSFSKCLTWCLWVNWSSGFSFLSLPAKKESKNVYTLYSFLFELESFLNEYMLVGMLSSHYMNGYCLFSIVSGTINNSEVHYYISVCHGNTQRERYDFGFWKDFEM